MPNIATDDQDATTSGEDMISQAFDLLAQADNDQDGDDQDQDPAPGTDDATDDNSSDDNLDEDEGDTDDEDADDKSDDDPDDDGEDEEDDLEDDEDEDDDDDTDEGDGSPGEFDSDYTYFDEDEGRELFLKATSDDGSEESIYLDRQSAQEGLQKQLTYIAQLKKEKEELNSAKAEAENQVAFFNSTMDEKMATELLIRQRMPEDLAGLNADEITEADTKEKYVRARMKAEIQLEADVQKAKDDRKAAQQQREDAKAASKKFVDDKLKNLKTLGIRNSENQKEFREKLKEEKAGTTIRSILETAAEAWGEEVAELMLTGFAANFQTATQKKVTDEVKKDPPKVRPKKRKTGGGKRKPKEYSAEDQIRMGFKDPTKKRRRR